MHEQKPSNDKQQKREFIRYLSIASNVGINLVVSIFVGFAIGYGLDKLFGTSPYLTIIFFVLGIITGFKYLFKIALRAGNNKESQM